MKRNLKIILLLALSIFVLVGCQQKPEEQAPVQQEPTQTAEVVKTDETSMESTSTQEVKEKKPFVEIENYDDEILVLEERPVRIASMVLGTDEILLQMVPEEYIVGLSGQVANADSVSLVAEKGAKYPVIENNFETLLSLNPDLIIGSSWINKELLQQIKDAKIPYYGYKSPNTIDAQLKVIGDFSKVLGSEQIGDDLTSDISKRVDVIKEKAQKIAEEDKVSILPYNMHGKTNAKGTIVDEIIYMIGAKNAATEAGLEKRAKIAKEKIIEIDPDYILMMAWGKDNLEDFDKFVEDMKNDPSFKDLKAIKNNHVIIEKGRYFTIVTQHLINGIEFLAKSVYPNVYGN